MDLAGLTNISGKFLGSRVVSCLIGLTLWVVAMNY